MTDNTSPPIDRNLQRVEVMIAQGARAEARLYVILLARIAHMAALNHRANLVGRESARKLAEAEDLREQRYREAHARFGFGDVIPAAAKLGEHNTAILRYETVAEGLVIPVLLPDATLSHPARNPFWPGAVDSGIYITCEERTSPRRYYLEAQIHVPDLGRTQLALRRTCHTSMATVRELAGRWAAMGFAILAAEQALQDREGVVFAAPAPATPDTAAP